MALFQAGGQGHLDVDSEVFSLRSQGLTDDQILSELEAKGAKEQQVISALSKLQGSPGMPSSNQDFGGDKPSDPFSNPNFPGSNQSLPVNSAPPLPQSPSSMQGPLVSAMPSSSEDLYDRIEEITEEMIDEKWDDLIKEVRKVVEWKNVVESRLQKMDSDLSKLKEDFKLLHQGVIGKVEEYDRRMQEVGVELKAVGKVFKDVVPVFTENVKELRSITRDIKEK